MMRVIKIRKAIYPGSFDPVTSGHLDIIQRAAALFDHVIVSIAVNNSKKPIFTTDERISLLKRAVEDIPNVSIDKFDGLLVDYALLNGAKVIIKGLRAISDFDYEFQMALMNKKLEPSVETIFMMTRPEYAFLSSSMVKEVGILGGSIEGLVPEKLVGEIIKRLKKED